MGLYLRSTVFKAVLAAECLSGKLTLLSYKHKRNPHADCKWRGKNKTAGFNGRNRINLFILVNFNHAVNAIIERFGMTQYACNVVKQNPRLWKVRNSSDYLVQYFKIFILCHAFYFIMKISLCLYGSSQYA